MCTIDGGPSTRINKAMGHCLSREISRGSRAWKEEITDRDMRTLGAGFVDHGCDRVRLTESGRIKQSDLQVAS